MPRNKYPEETVKKILDTSLQLFAEKGYEQTTVLDIVNNLGGLTRGAFYHHFKSKEEVLEAIFQRDDKENNPFYKAIEADVPNGLERLKLVLKLALQVSAENLQRKSLSNVVHSMLANPRFLAEHIKDVRVSAKQMATILDEGMADGSIKLGNSMIIAELFMLLTNVWMMPSLFPCSKDDMAIKVEMICQIFEGLGYHFIDENLDKLYLRLLDGLHDQEK